MMNWTADNQTYLLSSIERLKAILIQQVTEQESPFDIPVPISVRSPDEIESSLQSQECTLSLPPALIQLRNLFGLSDFERDVLLLCMGTELDSSFPVLLSALHGDPQRTYPTFHLALNFLPNPYLIALTPTSALRRWQLIEIGMGRSLSSSPLRIDERILSFLLGVKHLDEALVGVVKPILPQTLDSDESIELVASHTSIAQTLSNAWMQAQTRNPQGRNPVPVVQLCGGEISDRRAIASAICQEVGLTVHRLAMDALPRDATEVQQLARRWQREACLSNSALLLEWNDYDSTESTQNRVLSILLETIDTPILISSREQQILRDRAVVTSTVTLPTVEEQMELWRSMLDIPVSQLNGQVQQLVSQFHLNGSMIRSACLSVSGQIHSDGMDDEPDNLQELESLLWNACRVQTRSRMDNLAQRIESASTWDDLILPNAQKTILRDIAAHLRQRIKVYQDWGFATKNKRGLGIAALFSGASGTGKTLAAEVLAEELRLDLYKIDLSAIISKYIGETEKNLSRVFDAAEAGGAILLFDEADALFGKRNEVKDSHDRYANIEVSYLLQRMEAYRGLAILTTNLPDSIDRAFLRRIRFIVQFPFPNLAERTAIWQRMFPLQTPTEDLVFKKLARLNVAGGNIRNIALNAAFIAADANEPIRMGHLLDATRREYQKLELPLTDVEIKGWI